MEEQMLASRLDGGHRGPTEALDTIALTPEGALGVRDGDVDDPLALKRLAQRSSRPVNRVPLSHAHVPFEHRKVQKPRSPRILHRSMVRS
jgi:hypothetical protein